MTDEAPSTPPAPTSLAPGERITLDSHLDFAHSQQVRLAVQLDPDGSRRVLQCIIVGEMSWRVHHRVDLGGSDDIWIHWGLGNVGDRDYPDTMREIKPGEYLPYPADGAVGLSQASPVNQIPNYWKWMRHICTFAHEIDALYSHETLQLRDPDNYAMIPGSAVRDSEVNLRNRTALRYGRAICGFSFERVTRWAAINPHTPGRRDATALFWQEEEPGVQDDVEALCLTCNHAHWLRQFLRKHDILPWVNAFDSALTKPGTESRYWRVPKIDRTVDPWVPHATENVTTIAGNAGQVPWWKRQMTNFGKAVDFYDDHFGRREE